MPSLGRDGPVEVVAGAMVVLNAASVTTADRAAPAKARRALGELPRQERLQEPLPPLPPPPQLPPHQWVLGLMVVDRGLVLAVVVAAIIVVVGVRVAADHRCPAKYTNNNTRYFV